MDLDNHDLKDAETEYIVSNLISHVAKSDEEIEEEQEEKKPGKTELKVFVAENRGFELGTLDHKVEALAEDKEVNQHVTDFLDAHNFSEERLNDEVSFVEITTPNYERTDQFVFVDQGQYLRVITAERRTWTKKTVEKLVQYLPSLERLFLSSDDLRDIVDSLPDTSIAGFTAKFHAYHSEKSVTIQFHGGTEADLEKVEEEFGAKPTRLAFNQSNSPEAVVQSSVDRKGYYKQTSVLRGYEQLGLETLEQIFEEYGKHDQQHFGVEFVPKREPVKDGFAMEGYTTVCLREQEGDGRRELSEKLAEDILGRKRRFKYSAWEEGNFLVFDTETGEPFEISVEGRDIVLHAKEATTSTTLRDFCHILLEEFNSTYRLEKRSGEVRA